MGQKGNLNERPSDDPGEGWRSSSRGESCGWDGARGLGSDTGGVTPTPWVSRPRGRRLAGRRGGPLSSPAPRESGVGEGRRGPAVRVRAKYPTGARQHPRPSAQVSPLARGLPCQAVLCGLPRLVGSGEPGTPSCLLRTGPFLPHKLTEKTNSWGACWPGPVLCAEAPQGHSSCTGCLGGRVTHDRRGVTHDGRAAATSRGWRRGWQGGRSLRTPAEVPSSGSCRAC